MSQEHIGLRSVVVVSLGNALSFYDFFVYSYFAIQIGHTFFPESHTSHGLLFSLASFGVGFITRPLGGIVIGRYGDKAGRKAAMFWSFGLMGTSILGLAVIPSHEQIGLAAPILLLIVRLVQGFAVGGEVGPSTAFLLEAAPTQQRALYVSLQAATQYLAVIFAGVVGFLLAHLLSADQLDSWGWRVAFLVGAAVVPLGLYVRRSLPETLKAHVETAVTAEQTRSGTRLLGLALMMLSGGTMCAYVVSYMATYSQDTLKLDANAAFGTPLAEGLSFMLVAPLAGMVSDRIGRKPVILTGLGLMFLLVLPCYMVMSSGHSANVVYAATAILGGLMAVSYVPSTAAIVESLPRSMRSGAFAILYSVAGAVFGGFTQFTVKWLLDVTNSPLAPGWYSILGLIIWGAGTVAFRESAPCRGGR
jgi:MFS family permease